MMLWGRNWLIRTVGALLSSVLGPVIAWGASKIMFLSVGQRLLRYAPSEGSTYIINQDITLNQLLWIPLQDAGFYLVVILFFLFVLFMRGEVVRPVSRGYTWEDLVLDWSLDRFLDARRQEAKRGKLAYQVVIWTSVLLALPVMGLISYGTLQILLSKGVSVPIKQWMDITVFGTGVVLGLLFFLVNGAVALQDGKPGDETR